MKEGVFRPIGLKGIFDSPGQRQATPTACQWLMGDLEVWQKFVLAELAGRRK